MRRIDRCHFDDDAIIEVTALTALQNLSSKFNATLGVAPQGFCKVAPQPGTEKTADVVTLGAERRR